MASIQGSLMRYVATRDFMERLFNGEVSRRVVVDELFEDSDIAAIAGEHGVDPAKLQIAIAGDESSTAGAQLREAVVRMRAEAGSIPAGTAFPPSLDRATDGGLELVGLFVNPLTTTAMILNRPAPPIEEVARAIDPRLSLAAYASRVFRVLAVQVPQLGEALSNAAQALEHA